MKSLVWTRPASDWVSDEALLKPVAAKATVVRLPCVKIIPLPAPDVKGSFDAFVFTSSKAADIALADAKVLAAARAAKAVYTHGPSTAKTLARHGLKAIVIDARTGAELAAALKLKLAKGNRVLWPRASDPAHDLAGDLSGAGIKTESFVCYRTESRVYGVDGKPLPESQLAALRSSLAGVVCLASPSAVTGFLKDLPGANLVAVALGPTTAKACAGHFQSTVTASENGLEALIRAAASAIQD